MASRDYALNIIGKVEKYQKELAKVPGMTDKAAARAAIQMEKRLNRAQSQAAKEAKKAAMASAKRWESSFKSIQLTLDVTSVMNAVGAVGSLGQQVADMRNQLVDAETRTGIYARTLAGLKLAAEGSGQQFAALESGLNQFPKRLSDVARGTGEARVAFEALGVEAKDANGDLRSSDEVFRELVKKIQAVENPTERAALAVAAFGESGGKVVQALGTTELESFVDQAERFGVDVGPAAQQSAANWQRSMAELNLVFEQSKAELADTLNAGQMIDNVVLGFVFAKSAIGESLDVITQKAGIMFEAFTTPISQIDWGELQEEMKRVDDQQDAILDTAMETAREFWEARQATRGAAEANKELAAAAAQTGSAFNDQAAASKAAQEALKEQREEMKRLRAENAETAQAQVDAMQGLIETTNRLEGESLPAHEQLRLAYDKQISQLNQWAEELQAIPGHEAVVARAREAIQRDYYGKVVELQAEQAEDAKKRSQEVFEYEQKKLQERRESHSAFMQEWASENQAYFNLVTGMVDQFMGTWQQLNQDQLNREVDTLDERIQARKDKLARLQELEEQRGEAMTEAQRERLQAEIAGEKASLQTLNGQRKSAAEKLWKAERRAALWRIGIDTARNAVSMAGPPPVGLGVPAGPIAAAALGAMSAGLVLAKPQPKFHLGTGRSGVQPDEVQATLQRGEGVASRRAMAIDGVPELIESLNRGTTRALPTPQVQVNIGGRAIDHELVRIADGDGRFGARMRGRAVGMAGVG